MNGAFPEAKYIMRYNKDIKSSLLERFLPLKAFGLLKMIFPEKPWFSITFTWFLLHLWRSLPFLWYDEEL